jgi:hypothetical protein
MGAMDLNEIVIYCADVGSVKNGNFGWARLNGAGQSTECQTGDSIAGFADVIAADLNQHRPVALGFECPLFVPVPEDPRGLTSARPGEGNRAWSAGAGAGSLATGLTETVWVLRQIAMRFESRPQAFLDWRAFVRCKIGLFVWEAFVTSDAKAGSHHGDAELAVRSFQGAFPSPDQHNAVICTGPVRSLIGAALLQTGWGSDMSWLATPCVVIRTRATVNGGVTAPK